MVETQGDSIFFADVEAVFVDYRQTIGVGILAEADLRFGGGDSLADAGTMQPLKEDEH